MEKQKIIAGWLIDGTGSPAGEKLQLTIEAGRITSVGSAVSKETHDGDAWLDLSEYTLLPTLFDCHAHLAISGAIDPEFRNMLGSLGYNALESIINEHIEAYLKHGILSVRDGGDRYGRAFRYREECEKLKEVPFRIHTPGIAFHREGRYGRFIGKAVTIRKDLLSAIEVWVKKGIDHIKMIQSGINSLSIFGKQTEPQFEKDDISHVFALCNSRGVGLMIHANGEKPVGIAIDGGCDSIEHGFFMGTENLQKMADAQITWVPTAVTMKAYAELLPIDSIESQVARRTLDDQLEQLVSARRYGVPVALGTDAGSPGVYHGKAVGEELQLLISAGYSVEEAIRCATTNAAVLLKSDMTGQIKAGDPASFIAVKGTPAQIPERISGIEKVMVSGREVVMSSDDGTTRPIHE